MRPRQTLFLFAAFIVYASFYPFDFDAARWRAATEGSLSGLLRFSRTSAGDILGNVLAYVPIGLLLRLCLREGAKGLLWTVLCGLLLSTTVEVLQNATMYRDPSYYDVAMNTAGTALGALIGASFRKRLLKVRMLPRVSRPALVLAALWIVMHAAPLIPALEMGTVAASLSALRPFRFTIEGVARWMACYMIFAELVREFASPKRFHRALALGLALSLLCRLLFRGQTLGWNELLALCLALPLILFGPRSGKPAWVVLVALLLCAGLTPFRFEAPERQPFRWIAYGSYHDLIRKAFLTFGTTWVAFRAGMGRFGSAMAAMSVFAVIEYCQAHMNTGGQVPEFADPLLALSAILILERK